MCASLTLPNKRYGKTPRAQYSGAVCGSPALYHVYSNSASNGAESFVPRRRWRSASMAECSEAYKEPATWWRSVSPAGY